MLAARQFSDLQEEGECPSMPALAYCRATAFCPADTLNVSVLSYLKTLVFWGKVTKNL
jgi:hypothetical protein